MQVLNERMKNRGQGGFTLIELLVVIAILAVLSGAAIIGIGSIRTNAQKTACKSDLDTVSTAAEAVVIDTNATALPTMAALISANYIKKGIAAGDVTIGGNVNAMTFAAAAGGKYNAGTVTACNTP